MKLYSKNPCYLDYERLVGDGVDAIELRHSIRFRDCLDGWDCDCVFVMNPEAVMNYEAVMNPEAVESIVH